MMVSPLASLVLLVPVHLVSQRPSNYRLYLCISWQTCALFPVSYRVLMFQVPILVLVLVVRRVVSTPASLGLSPVHVMGSTREDSSSTKLASRVAVAVSVTVSFLQNGVVSPILTPNLEDQWVLFVWSLPLDLSDMGGPTRRQVSR